MLKHRWGLAKTPFTSETGGPLVYESMHQREALARLRFLVANDRQFGLVVGERGVGKSLLLEAFARESRDMNYQVARFSLWGLSVREFYWQLAEQLRAGPRTDDDQARLLRRLDDRLCENRLNGSGTILLVDDADQVLADTQTQLARLVSSAGPGERGVLLVLTAETQHAHRLGRLLELVDLRIDLEPWSEEDTVGYLQHALVAAGSDRPLFDEQALYELHRLSGGVPRMVIRLAEYALLSGHDSDADSVSLAMVQDAYQAISIPD